MRYFRASSMGVFQGVGQRVRKATLEPNAYQLQYLVQRISVAVHVQRGNAASVLHGVTGMGSQTSVLGRPGTCDLVLFCCCCFCFVHWVLFVLNCIIT